MAIKYMTKYIGLRPTLNYITTNNLACQYDSMKTIRDKVKEFCHMACTKCKNSIHINGLATCINIMYAIEGAATCYLQKEFKLVGEYLKLSSKL